ncbi:MAG: AMP-binding protein, partial [Anaerolineae bacterium]
MEKPWLSHYEDGVPADLEIPDYPVTQNLIDAAKEYPHKPALIFGNVVEPLGNMLMDATMSYRELLDLTYRFAAALQQFGVEKGDRVAVHLPNCPQ